MVEVDLVADLELELGRPVVKVIKPPLVNVGKMGNIITRLLWKLLSRVRLRKCITSCSTVDGTRRFYPRTKNYEVSLSSDIPSNRSPSQQRID